MLAVLSPFRFVTTTDSERVSNVAIVARTVASNSTLIECDVSAAHVEQWCNVLLQLKRTLKVSAPVHGCGPP
jgi:hypothetical protein